jgi:hypothetical protein
MDSKCKEKDEHRLQMISRVVPSIHPVKLLRYSIV